jgi:predicted Zn finger-like uncharacterized protein
MAESLTIACPECDKQFTVPAAAVGKKMRCKGCEHVFEIAAPAGARATAAAPARAAPKPPPAKRAPAKTAPQPAKKKKPLDDDEDDDGKPYGVTDVKLGARCPNCSNALESEEDLVCLKCGYHLITRIQAQPREVADVTGMDQFLWLLPAILSVVFSIGLLVFDVLYCYKIENWLGGTKEDWYVWLFANFAVKLWLCIVSAFFIFFACRYAFIRFVFHPTPPEVEVRRKTKE